MTDSPLTGPVHQPGRRHWSTHPTSNHRTDRSRTDTNLLRPQQRAPPGVGVKDLRPLRGRPCGSIPDPDASPRRAHKQAENLQEKDQHKNYRLTGPAPSGMTLKAYTKGEHALRFEAVVHNTRALRCGRVLANFPTIIGKLAGMVARFTTTLDCVDHTFIADDLLDRLPTPTQVGATRVGGVDLNKPRIRAALSAVLALSAASGGFTVAEFTAKVHAMTGHTGYTIRQAAYDLRKLRGKELITKPGRTRRYHLEPPTAGTIAALLTLRDQVIAPILAGVRSPRMGRKPITWTSVDRDYEKIRIDMQTLFQDLGIRAAG